MFRRSDGTTDLIKINDELSKILKRDELVIKIIKGLVQNQGNIGIVVQRIDHIMRLVQSLRKVGIKGIPLLDNKDLEGQERLPTGKVFVVIAERLKKISPGSFNILLFCFISNLLTDSKFILPPVVIWAMDDGLLSNFYKRKYEKWCQETKRKFIE